MNARIAIVLRLLAVPLLAVPLLAFSVPATASEPSLGPDRLMTMRVDGDITIDSQGHVTQYKITTPVTPTIEKALDAAVHGWRFHAVQVDGQPANARSIMRVTLAAREASNGYAISVDNVTFRDVPKDEGLKPGEVREEAKASAARTVQIRPKSIHPVKYPRTAQRAGIAGSVLVYVNVGEDGSASDVVAVQSTLYDIRANAGALHELRKSLEDSAVYAIKQWRFDVRLNGAAPTPANLSRTMRVDYVAGNSSEVGSPGQWRIESRSAWKQAPWLVDQRTAQKIKVSDLDAGEVMQVASAFQPPEGVIGKAL